jgi:hypothetical protein
MCKARSIYIDVKKLVIWLPFFFLSSQPIAVSANESSSLCGDLLKTLKNEIQIAVISPRDSQALAVEEFLEAWGHLGSKRDWVMPHDDETSNGLKQPINRIKYRGDADLAVPDIKYIIDYMDTYYRQLKIIEVAPGLQRFRWNTKSEKEAAVRAKAAALAILDNVYHQEVFQHDLERAKWIKEVFDATIDDLYQDSHTQLLKVITFRELTGYKDDNKNIVKFVRKKRYMATAWWRSSSQDAVIVTSGTHPSRSLLKSMVGEGGFRRIYWPVVGHSAHGNVSLNLIRIAVNYLSSGEPHSLETIVKDINGNWQPFFFERIGGEWYPVSKIVENRKETEVSELCMRCHLQANRFSPRPRQMRDFEDFELEGYFNQTLINQLLDVKNWR